jgi:hypothetical protein
MPHDTPLPQRTLPCCGYAVDTATEIHGEAVSPKQGDFTICLRCGQWLRFQDDQGAVAPLTLDDWIELPDAERHIMRRLSDQLQLRGPLLQPPEPRQPEPRQRPPRRPRR